MPEGRELRRSRTFDDFMFGSPPSPGRSPGTGKRKQMNLLSRPSPDMNAARKKVLSRSDEKVNDNHRNDFFERPKKDIWKDDVEEPKREITTSKLDEKNNEFERTKREAKNVDRNDHFERRETESRETKSSNIETINDDNFERPKREVRFQKSSNSQRPKTTTAFLLDFQRRVIQKENAGDRRPRRVENESRQTSRPRNGNASQELRQNSRPRNGNMLRAKSLNQLFLAPRESPKRSRKLEKAVSTFEFEEFHPDSDTELLSSNPKVFVVQRKETRL